MRAGCGHGHSDIAAQDDVVADADAQAWRHDHTPERAADIDLNPSAPQANNAPNLFALHGSTSC
ncbi:MAG: hypothetical protein Kow00120_19480 [Anaerolineae bacterium]